jgi:uncharacterized protein (DUF111 family)
MDVVAAGSLAAALTGASWSVSDLPRGHGLVRTRHGLLPVPAPATAEILKGFRWRDDGIAGERVTPTGAAILAHLIPPATQQRAPGGRLTATGMGAGTRELAGMPNILRALVFAAPTSEDVRAPDDAVIVLSFDIDDMTGEEIGIAADRLRLLSGVLDLSIGTRLGKKGRPLNDFRLLLSPASLAAVCERCFIETSTIGLRWRIEQRACLPRQALTLAIGSGESVRGKRSLRPGGQSSLKIESDDVARFEGLIQRRRIKDAGENERSDHDA